MDENLRKLQLTQLEMLKIVDSICRQNNINYSLYGGTLLGAIRHKGFIPWDDDLDICMPRKDYNRFIALWKSNAPEGYILQNKENSPAFSQTFTKIRKDHTTFLQNGEPKNEYHTGIFIDIFPADRIPNGKINRLLFQWNGVKYLLFTREFIPPKGNPIEKIISSFLLSVVKKEKRPAKRKQLFSRLTKYSDKKLQVITTETLFTLRTPLPVDLLDEYVYIPFEDSEFKCFKKWDEFLSLKYNDYMQLPPENERTCFHHPLILDFERNYDEIPDNEKTDLISKENN